MSELKDRLRADLTAAMKSRDELVKSTLRMALTAINTAEVAGSEARELDDAEVVKVLAKEAKKRAESADAFAAAGRVELAAQERAEGEVLARYLPTQLTDDELATIAFRAVEETAAELGEQPAPRQMGQVMKKATAAVAGRADGGRVAAAVRNLLQPS
ncbi:GatB/YqeY domain-containing protein [Pseudonocardia asaccharolytica]|uniref:GatB/YqeY domain-containing protein n=1 Tax=Pseudonocardia asaccharolytica TaxID=54010 RepID=UPI000420E0C9|nr:GatB/YqeY domain-containing protein [Pseudonocardia asaccharolytica]